MKAIILPLGIVTGMFLAAFVAPILQRAPVHAQAPEKNPIRIEVGAGKAVTVTIPGVRKEDIASVLSSFFSQERPETMAKFQEVFRDAGDLTFVLTSKRGK